MPVAMTVASQLAVFFVAGAQTDALTDLQLRRHFLRIEGRHRRAAETNISRTVKRDCLFDQSARGYAVGRVQHRHARDCAHQGNILKGLMARAVLADRNARVGRADFDVCVGIADGVADDLKRSACREHREGTRADNFSRERQTACRSAVIVDLERSASMTTRFGVVLPSSTSVLP